jgi:hypothetical protein
MNKLFYLDFIFAAWIGSLALLAIGKNSSIWICLFLCLALLLNALLPVQTAAKKHLRAAMCHLVFAFFGVYAAIEEFWLSKIYNPSDVYDPFAHWEIHLMTASSLSLLVFHWFAYRARLRLIRES